MKLRYILRRFFNKDFQLLRETAFHEAGHVCVAKFAEFDVDSVMIDPEKPGTGITKINYKDSLDVVNALFELDHSSKSFNSLTNEKKSKVIPTIHKLIDSLLGGPLVEARHKALRDKQDNTEVIVEYSDFKMTNTIMRSLVNLAPHFNQTLDQKYVFRKVDDLNDILTLEEFWKSIDEIAKRILNSKTFRLSKDEIDKTLIDCRFWEFIESCKKN